MLLHINGKFTMEIYVKVHSGIRQIQYPPSTNQNSNFISRYWDIQIFTRKIRDCTKILVGYYWKLQLYGSGLYWIYSYIDFSSGLHWTSRKAESMKIKCSYQYFIISVWYVFLHQFYTLVCIQTLQNCSILLNR